MFKQNRTGTYQAKIRRPWPLIAAFYLLLLTSPLQAVEFQGLASISSAVNEYLHQRYASEKNIEYQIGRIDDRLQLSLCQQPLQVRPQVGARPHGYISLAVSCESEQPWKIFVPVEIRRYENVLIARTALPRGTYLGKHDVQFVRYDISRLHSGYFTKPEEIEEMVTSRSIRQGRVLTPQNVRPPRLVRRGESITILANSGNLVIRVKGQALMDGRKGDTIRVRNTRSKREIQATVVSDGVVKVSL